MSEHSVTKPVGRVVGLWRYPVKSMGPEVLTEADIGWDGVTGDRRWAFIRPHVVRSGFPWLTLRQCPTMSHYRPFFTDPSQPNASPTMVKTPSGSVLEVTDAELKRELSPDGDASLIRQSRGIFDTFPLSVITTQTIAELGKRVNAPLDVQRFRPNVLIEAVEDRPFLGRYVGGKSAADGQRSNAHRQAGWPLRRDHHRSDDNQSAIQLSCEPSLMNGRGVSASTGRR